jgi:hypothetical protein
VQWIGTVRSKRPAIVSLRHSGRHGSWNLESERTDRWSSNGPNGYRKIDGIKAVAGICEKGGARKTIGPRQSISSKARIVAKQPRLCATIPVGLLIARSSASRPTTARSGNPTLGYRKRDALIDPCPKFLRSGRKTTEATPKPCTTRTVASHMLSDRINCFSADRPIPCQLQQCSLSLDLDSPQSPMISGTCEPINYSVGWQKSYEKTQKREWDIQGSGSYASTGRVWP